MSVMALSQQLRIHTAIQHGLYILSGYDLRRPQLPIDRAVSEFFPDQTNSDNRSENNHHY